MPVHPIEFPGRAVPGGSRTVAEEAMAHDPEGFARRQAEFREAMDAIDRAERQAWRRAHHIVIR